MWIPAELFAETVRHTGSLISSIRRSWEVTQAPARAGGLGQENEALVAAKEAAVATFRNSLRLLGGIVSPRSGMKAFAFGDRNKAARQTIVERLTGMCAGRQWNSACRQETTRLGAVLVEERLSKCLLSHFLLDNDEQRDFNALRVSRNPLGTGQDNRLSIRPAYPRGAGFGWRVCALMDVSLIVQVDD